MQVLFQGCCMQMKKVAVIVSEKTLWVKSIKDVCS